MHICFHEQRCRHAHLFPRAALPSCTSVSTSSAAVRCCPSIHFTLRAARDTAARVKGTIAPSASDLAAPQQQRQRRFPLLAALAAPWPWQKRCYGTADLLMNGQCRYSYIFTYSQCGQKFWNQQISSVISEIRGPFVRGSIVFWQRALVEMRQFELMNLRAARLTAALLKPLVAKLPKAFYLATE